MSKFNYALQYPYELNEKLNSSFLTQEQVSNFTSLLSDKDRFDNLLKVVSQHIGFLEEIMDIQIEDKLYEIFIIRAELFQSTPKPLIIEYDITPEKMVLHLFKEIVKNTLGYHQIRCIDEIQQLTLICATLLSFSRYLDDKSNTKFESFCEFVFNNEITLLAKKGFEVTIDMIYSINISNDDTLVSIIEKSYEQLY